MDIIHDVNKKTLPRHLQRALAERLRLMPAIVVTGARQTGKSTLVQVLTPGERRFFSLDDLDVVELARRDPEALVGGSAPVTLDEVQREPDLLLAVKRAIDRRRRAGQFLLTGSANLLLMRGVSESLAGRASYLAIWPMTRREQQGLGTCGVWEDLVGTDEGEWLDRLRADSTGPEDWRAVARRGGFPTPAVHMTTPAERTVWFEGYVRTYLERDLHTLSSIAALPDFRRLMRAACLRLGQLGNQTELARDVAAAAYRTPLHEPARDLIPARARAGVCGEPHEAVDKIAQALLGRHGAGAAFGRSHRAGRSASGESRVE
jgi:hypothetical protein